MRVLFFGSGAFGLPSLRHLSSTRDVAAIISQPDRPAGRNRRLTPTPIAEWAIQHGREASLIRTENANDPAIVDRLHGMQCDAWIIIAFGQKLGHALLKDKFAINLHASLLPRWRGAAPINHAIIAGDHITGNSVITLADRMDAGEVLGQSERPVSNDLTAGQLHDLLADDGPSLIDRVLHEHASGTLRYKAQDESKVTIAPKLTRSDGWIDFARPAIECRRRIHGLNPWPGVTVQFREQPLKLLRAKSTPPTGQSSQDQPGMLIDPDAGLVRCGEQSHLQLIEVQPPGKRPMSWDEFSRGHHPASGEQLIGSNSS